MSNNIMKFQHRKFCDLFPIDYYQAEITNAKVVIARDIPNMVVDFLVDGGSLGKRTLTEWLDDSDKEQNIKKRKQLFNAIGHPEYFDIEQFDVTWLISSKLLVKLGQSTNKKTNEVRNVFNEFVAEPFNDPTKVPSTGFQDDKDLSF